MTEPVNRICPAARRKELSLLNIGTVPEPRRSACQNGVKLCGRERPNKSRDCVKTILIFHYRGQIDDVNPSLCPITGLKMALFRARPTALSITQSLAAADPAERGASSRLPRGDSEVYHALADYGLVIASDAEKGGTWAGATEALKARWVPVFVLSGPNAPRGNRLLLQKGGLPFPDPFPDQPSALGNWLTAHAVQAQPFPTRAGLF